MYSVCPESVAEAEQPPMQQASQEVHAEAAEQRPGKRARMCSDRVQETHDTLLDLLQQARTCRDQKWPTPFPAVGHDAWTQRLACKVLGLLQSYGQHWLLPLHDVRQLVLSNVDEECTGHSCMRRRQLDVQNWFLEQGLEGPVSQRLHNEVQTRARNLGMLHNCRVHWVLVGQPGSCCRHEIFVRGGLEGVWECMRSVLNVPLPSFCDLLGLWMDDKLEHSKLCPLGRKALSRALHEDGVLAFQHRKLQRVWNCLHTMQGVLHNFMQDDEDDEEESSASVGAN